MKEVSIRLSRPGDEAVLKQIWNLSFGDDISYIEGFFDKVYLPGMALIAELDSVPISSVYIVPTGGYDNGGGSVFPCAMLYAMATLPRFRGKGSGSALLRAALEHSRSSGFSFISAVPATDGLFSYYRQAGFSDAFNITEASADPSSLPPLSGALERADPSLYNAVRETLLAGVPHIRIGIDNLSYTKEMLSRTGGDLFVFRVGGKTGCAAAERSCSGRVFIKELLAERGDYKPAVSLVASAMPAPAYLVRVPPGVSELGGRIRRFAMLSPPAGENLPKPESRAWFGLAWD